MTPEPIQPQALHASLFSRYGVDGHPEDRFWARRSDVIGRGRLVRAADSGDRLEVEVEACGLLVYLDTTNPACRGDLFNLTRIPDGLSVVFSGSVRAFDGRGVRMGRLELHPCSVAEEMALFTPKVRFGKFIELGEGRIQDPCPEASSFAMIPSEEGVRLALIEEVRVHAS